MSVTMWIVGGIIFAVYMYFTIWNINNGSKQKKTHNARKKKKTVRRQLVDNRKSK